MERAALRELQAADYLCDGCVAAARALAEIHVAAGRLATARPYLERAFAAAPDPWLRKALALTALRAGSADSAAALLAEAPPAARDVETWLLLAEADRERGIGERWRPFLDEDPPGTTLPEAVRRSASFWAVVAEAFSRGDQPRTALAAIDLALARAPADTVYLGRRIILLQDLGRTEAARADYQRLQAARAGKGQSR
jgi:tetratricopeptide (TPR) repeat protein